MDENGNITRPTEDVKKGMAVRPPKPESELDKSERLRREQRGDQPQIPEPGFFSNLLSGDTSSGGGGGPVAPVAPAQVAPQQQQILPELPPAAQFTGRTFRDTKTGKRMKSNGRTWIPIK
jgi:hypothetical protein